MTALETLADEFYDYAIALSPISLMWTGKIDRLAEWDDFTPEGRATACRELEDFAARAEAIDPGTDPQAIVLRDVIITTARAEIARDPWTPELLHLNPRMGVWEMLLSFIGNFPLTTAEHGEAYLAKLRAMPAMLDQLMDVAEAAAGEGRVALRRHLEETAASVEGYLNTAAGASERLCCQAAPTGLDEAGRRAWTQQRNRIVAELVRPALRDFAARVSALAERGMPDDKPGLVHLEGGAQVYRGKMWSNLLIDITPEQVHQMGLDQVAKLEDEYRALAGPLLGTDDIAEIYARLRDDESLRYDSADAIVADAEKALAKANAEAPKWFRHLPVSECTAHATEFGAMAYYSTPDPKTGKQGQFYFKTSDPHAWATYELEAITYHEAIPGHHLQLALAAENESVHQVQREFHNTAFSEGWGLYTERLSEEMGMYSSDLSRIGMLSADSLRACRLVVDTGMHALGWSREQAIQYLLDHSPMDREHIEQEIDRYIGLPGQATAYMVGRLEIQAIRAEAEQRDGFDIRDFHDTVLRHGAVPLETLRKIVLG
ncbi:DUF885 domain-containing protein [Demequina pelophila]|uniref:DUF885 domain-containing protein n=1 Tax=Demequina pelophila TaxID=1638984 RepID=UPI0007850E8F|nr:DUF885 domain-containing protein [Demequina pelophila]